MSEAYKWLNTLPPQAREEIKSMEQAVLLYLRTKRVGRVVPTQEDIDAVGTTPAATARNAAASKSAQDFQNALKTLRPELDQFDFAPGASGPQPRAATADPLAPQAGTPPLNPTGSPSQTQSHAQSQSHSHSQNTLPRTHAVELDQRSKQTIHEIKEALNLSSDIEVIRLCLSLGKKQLRDLL